MTGERATTEEERGTFPRPFGRYLLLHHLGQGGMGDVYLAKQTGLAGIERYCVVKVVATTRGKPKQHIARFFDEARVVVHLNHQNICSVSEVGEVEGELFLAMDYVAGQDLNAILRERKRQLRPMPVGLALFVQCELLRALDYAHRLKHPTSGEPLGIVHRDVSPQNVLLSLEGEVKLIDFGVATSSLKREQTSEGFVLGKLAYISPEQARSEKVEVPADIYAAGIIAYELVTGTRYYSGLNKLDLVGVISSGKHVPRGWDQIDPDLAKLLKKALAQDPASRYDSCSQFRRTIEQYQRDKGHTAGSDELREYVRKLFPDAGKETRLLLASFADVAAPMPTVSTPPAAAEATVGKEATPIEGPGRLDVGDHTEEITAERSGPTEHRVSDDFSGSEATDLMQSAAAIAPALHLPAPDVTDRIQVRRPIFDEHRRPRARRPWIALAVASAVIVVALVFLSRLRSEDVPRDDELPQLQPPQLELADQKTNPPLELDAGGAPDRSARQPDAALEAVAISVDAAVQTPSSPDEVEPRPRPKSKRRKARNRRSEKAAATPPTTTREKLELMKACTGRRPCAKQVLEKSTRMRELEFDEVRRFPAELDRCVKRCMR